MKQHLCLFTAADKLSVPKQKEFYYRMCKALEYTDEKIIGFSAIYAHYGLFDRMPFTETTIKDFSRLSAPAGCAKLCKKVAYKEFEFQNGPCLLCTDSPLYKNNRENDELIVLKYLMTEGNPYEYINLTSSYAFTSYKRLSDDYAIGKQTIIQINKMLYDFLEKNPFTEANKDEFFAAFSQYVLVSLDEIADAGVCRTQIIKHLEQILKIKEVSREVYEVAADKLNEPYTYKPVSITSPVASVSNSQKKKAKQTQMENAEQLCSVSSGQTNSTSFSFFGVDHNSILSSIKPADSDQNATLETQNKEDIADEKDMPFCNNDETNENATLPEQQSQCLETQESAEYNGLSPEDSNTETSEICNNSQKSENATEVIQQTESSESLETSENTETASESDTDNICADCNITGNTENITIPEQIISDNSNVNTPTLCNDTQEPALKENTQEIDDYDTFDNPFSFDEDDELIPEEGDDPGVPSLSEIKKKISREEITEFCENNDISLPNQQKINENNMVLNGNLIENNNKEIVPDTNLIENNDTEISLNDNLNKNSDKEILSDTNFAKNNDTKIVSDGTKDNIVENMPSFVIKTYMDLYTVQEISDTFRAAMHCLSKADIYTFSQKIYLNAMVCIETALYNDYPGLIVYLPHHSEYYFYNVELLGMELISLLLSDHDIQILTTHPMQVRNMLQAYNSQDINIQSIDALYWVYNHHTKEPYIENIMQSVKENYNPATEDYIQYALRQYPSIYSTYIEEIHLKPDMMKDYRNICNIFSVLSLPLYNKKVLHRPKLGFTMEKYLNITFNFDWSERFTEQGIMLRIGINEADMELSFTNSWLKQYIILCFNGLHHTNNKKCSVMSVTTKAVYIYYSGNYQEAMRLYDSVIYRLQKGFSKRYKKALQSNTLCLLYN